MTETPPTPRVVEEHGFHMEDRDGARLVSVPQIRRRVPGSFLALFTVLAGSGAVLRYLLVDGPAASQFYLVGVALCAVLGYLTLVAAINRTIIRADAEGFTVSVRPFPWARSRHFALTGFRGPYVAERKRRFQPWRTRRLVYDLCLLNEKARAFSLLRSFEDEAAARYAARILQPIVPADGPVSSESGPTDSQPNGNPG